MASVLALTTFSSSSVLAAMIQFKYVVTDPAHVLSGATIRSFLNEGSLVWERPDDIAEIAFRDNNTYAGLDANWQARISGAGAAWNGIYSLDPTFHPGIRLSIFERSDIPFRASSVVSITDDGNSTSPLWAIGLNSFRYSLATSRASALPAEGDVVAISDYGPQRSIRAAQLESLETGTAPEFGRPSMGVASVTVRIPAGLPLFLAALGRLARLGQRRTARSDA